MRYYSTKNKNVGVSFREAIFKGLPDDNGLFVPEQIPILDKAWLAAINQHSFHEIAVTISKEFIGDEIPHSAINDLIEKAIDFDAPVVELTHEIGIMELFHGPSLAFKDFGARFMAAMMGHFLGQESHKTTILVATSGDTGGAVAFGFLDVPGIEVVILYPSGKVSELQEKQLTTLGSNIRALEVNGTFDDCQAMVKQAFLDPELRGRLNLSSANSINIARLIPQSFYYANASKLAHTLGKNLVFTVPSGNFGNLTAGLYAREMGFPIHHFIAATNANDVFPAYINTGDYTPKPSVATLSNAMDVGNPSNFYRILDLYGSTWNNVKECVSSVMVDDETTLETMDRVYQETGYTLDPHAAVGYKVAEDWNKSQSDIYNIVLETAHPAKFLSVMEMAGIKNLPIPDRLSILMERQKQATFVQAEYSALKEYLMS